MSTGNGSTLTPSTQELELLARRFFDQIGRKDLGWGALEEKEKQGLLAEWRQVREQQAPANGSSGMFHRLFVATKGYIDRNNEALIKQLPSLIERDLSEIVKKALDAEMHYIWERQSAQAIRQAERLDNICAEMAKIKASDGKTHAQALDKWITELQAEVHRLGLEVAELKGRLR